MLCTGIERARIDHFHVCHFRGFVDGSVCRIVVIHAQQNDGTLIITQLKMLCEIPVHLRDELYGEWSAIERIEDCHSVFFLGGGVGRSPYRGHQIASMILLASTSHRKPGS